MEIAIWTTVLTTIITIIQTWFMWYFSQRVKLEDAEMDELVDKLEDDEPDPNYVTEESVAAQISSLVDWIDSEIDGHWEATQAQYQSADISRKALVERLNNVQELTTGLQDLTGGLLDAVDGLYTNMERLEAVLEAMMEDSNIEDPELEEEVMEEEEIVEDIVEDIVEEEIPEVDPEVEEKAKEVATQAFEETGQPRTRNNARSVGIRESAHRALQEAKAREEATEAPIKEARADGDPLITDLRAEPFQNEAETLDGIYDLPTFGNGYEAWGASSGTGNRPPRQRGFRRI